MERYTFDEIRNFKVGDVFWASNDKFVVNTDAVYRSTSDFYGDHSEKLEWTAVSETTHGEVRFQVTHTKDPNTPTNPIIFKTSNTQSIVAGAGQRME